MNIRLRTNPLEWEWERESHSQRHVIGTTN